MNDSSFRGRTALRAARRSRYRRLQLEMLEPRRYLTADPIITEFMASNSGGLLDGYGASSDWIEIYNPGDAAIDLAGYTLTDDEDEIDKWQFPEAILQPGQYLIVFASGYDKVDPSGHFHTNFGLSSGGEYLALANPQGNVLSEFGAGGGGYPAQSRSMSHGVAFDSTFTQVISPDSTASYLIPPDDSLDATWTAAEFDDSSWLSGAASLGYEATAGAYGSLIETTVPAGTSSIYVRISFQVDDPETLLGTLRLKYDDGFVAYLNGTRIASFHAPANLAYDSTATEFRPKEAAIEDAVFDISASSSLLQLGENVLSIHLLDANNSPSADLLLVPELTIGKGEIAAGASVGDLIAPTPGLPNTQRLASPVVFSQVGGVFANSLLLSMTAAPGETIRYTIDGSLPQADSPLYTDPLTISATTQVRARSFGTSGEVGRVRTEAYTLLGEGLAGVTSNLPIVVLENFGSGIPGRQYQDASFALYETNGITGRSSLSDQPTVTSEIGHHRRGSSTYSQPKPNLRVEFRDDNGNDRDVSLLGMPAEADWILYAPYNTDQSMMRNMLMFDLNGQIVDYTIRARFVEVYYNADGGELDADDYFGVYVLMENVEVGESRVAIDELTQADQNAPEITGGYILKLDRPDEEEDSSWETPRTGGTPSLVHVAPKRAELTAEQTAYIRNYIRDFEQALAGPHSTDPSQGYAAYIDVDSWIDHHLFRVFSRETDAVLLSEHLYKPRGGKLAFGPVWDFDRSAGSEGANSKSAEGWNSTSTNVFAYGWWGKLFQDPDFLQAWSDRWQELRKTTFSDANLTAAVDAQAAKIEEAQARNSLRWPSVAPNGGDYAEPGLVGWEAEVSHLKGWLIARAAWIDQQLPTPPTISQSTGGLPPEELATLSTTLPAGKIYYTLDGSDPRAEGGGIAPGALLYTEPFAVSGTTKINARTMGANDFFKWSEMVSSRFITAVPANVTNLRISELHYNPADPTAEELQAVPGIDNNSFEFVELVNIGNRPIDLTNVRFMVGITFNFSNAEEEILAPGETVLIVQNRNAFVARYGDGLNIAGEYSGRLDSAGEPILLIDAAGDEIHDFEYDDGGLWPTAADGDGPTLEVIDLLGDHRNSTNWRASSANHGSPGVASLPLVGDYDRSGIVDEDDYMAWRAQFGSSVAVPGIGADGNRDGVVDTADYTIYRDNLGATLPSEELPGDEPQAEVLSGAAAVTAPRSEPPMFRPTDFNFADDGDAESRNGMGSTSDSTAAFRVSNDLLNLLALRKIPTMRTQASELESPELLASAEVDAVFATTSEFEILGAIFGR